MIHRYRPTARMARWVRVGDLVSVARRRHPWTWPLRWWWGALDAVVTAWWVYGGRDTGITRRWYLALEDRWSRAYLTLYTGLWAWISRNIGD